MRKIALVAGVMLVLMSMPLHAQQDSTAIYWFTLSSTDTFPIDTVYAPQHFGELFTLHTWLMVDAPNWGYIGGFTFPIVYDTNYIKVAKCVDPEADSVTVDETTLGNYMFHGVRFPCDTIAQNPGQALWYAAVCFSGCMSSDSTPQHIGTITFKVADALPTRDSTVMVIDTGMYPPSNYATAGDETGTKTVWPEWHPFYLDLHVLNTAENTSPAPSFFLKTSAPNPFKDETCISFGVARKGNINISVYDITGRLVRTLVSGVKESGSYTVKWDGRDNNGRNLSSGAYFVRMKTGDHGFIKRVLLLR